MNLIIFLTTLIFTLSRGVTGQTSCAAAWYVSIVSTIYGGVKSDDS